MKGTQPLQSTLESLVEQIGAPGSPLKRPQSKESRVKLAALLDSTLSPELRLRAHLALRKQAPSDLLTEDIIHRSLTARDCLSRVSSLSVKLPVFDATASLRAAARLAQKASENDLRVAIGYLARTVEKWDANSDKFHVSDQTILEFIRLTDALCHMLSQVRNRYFKQIRELLLRLVEVAVRWAVGSKRTEQLVRALRLLGSVEKFVSLSIQQEMDKVERFAVVVRDLRQKSIDRMISSATSSDTSALEKLARALLGGRYSRALAAAKLDELYEERFALDEETQATLAALLERESAPARVEGLDSSLEQTKALQLASVLLRTWNARHEGPSSGEIYEVMKSVLSNFFDLHLIDQVDQVQAYNPRIHEFVQGEAHTVTVRIVRPLITQSQETTHIIVKALVRAATD